METPCREVEEKEEVLPQPGGTLVPHVATQEREESEFGTPRTPRDLTY